MIMERRSCIRWSKVIFNWKKKDVNFFFWQEEVLNKTKPFDLSKELVMQAYQRVKANAGSAGVDKQSLEDFERDLENNVYKLWNRMSSGSYFPAAVRAVPIPKKSGGVRTLGIPTVTDRIAQMVVKLKFEPEVERYFLPDSYGYRPNKSALDAVGITRQRCWQYDWVLEFDIKGLFDHIPHDLLMKAVRKHTECKWILLYIERWLEAPMQEADGSLVPRESGTPQGGVISPILSNLYLHYVFDKWMQRNYPSIVWCRYADDGLVHCETEQQAQEMLRQLRKRFEACELQLHPDKTQIVYCKDGRRKQKYPNTSFEFLGYNFRPRRVKSAAKGTLFVGFTPAVSREAQKHMRRRIRSLKVRNRTDLSLEEVAGIVNPIIRGWINYYGRYCRSMMRGVYRHINCTIRSWAMAKYKKLKHKTRASLWITELAKREPTLFAHWSKDSMGRFA